MNIVDSVVLGLILLNAVLGAVRGFASQAFRIASLFLAFGLAKAYAAPVGNLVASKFEEETSRQTAIGWVAIFIVVYLVMSMLGHVARAGIAKLRLGSADRSLGFLVGGGKGAVFAIFGIHMLTLVLNTPLVPAALADEMNPEKSKAVATYRDYVRPHLDPFTDRAVAGLGQPKK